MLELVDKDMEKKPNVTVFHMFKKLSRDVDDINQQIQEAQ